MKSISITAFNRPRYLKKVLQSLSLNNLKGYDKIYCGIEPGNDEVFEICRKIDFIEPVIILNKTVIGIRRNPYELLNRLFEEGSEFNVYLEDDSELSPDAIELANYHYNNFKNDEYFCCCFHNYQSSKEHKSKLIEKQEFWAIGFSLFATAWKKWYKSYWFDDHIAKEFNIGGIGWDWSIRASILKHKKQVLTPMFSRSMHIGRVGIHSSQEQYINQFSGKPYCKSKIGNFYK